MDDNISPELTHCPLHKIGLTIKSLKLGSIHTFLKKAIDPPPITAVNDALAMLTGNKIFNKNGQICLNINYIFSFLLCF